MFLSQVMVFDKKKALCYFFFYEDGGGFCSRQAMSDPQAFFAGMVEPARMTDGGSLIGHT